MKNLISLLIFSLLISLVSCKSKTDKDDSSAKSTTSDNYSTSTDKWGGESKVEFMNNRAQISTFQRMLRELGFKGEAVYKYDKELMECYYDGSTLYLEKLFPNGPIKGVNHRYKDLDNAFEKIITPCINKIKRYK